MNSSAIRRKFLDFFASKGHAIIPSASLIPENDPSVLFTTAGMHPLVPFLLGESHPAGRRLADVQKCVRTGDIDEVGDKTHLTFFEMLGNWSLGDYFKKEAIAWSYELLTDPDWFALPVSKLAVSVFAGDETAPRDDESAALWRELGIKEERIAYLGKTDNWWPAGGKHPGPQGPDTEIFFWTGEEPAPEKFDPADKHWVEIWNNVFMQFNNPGNGELAPLTQKNVDTGMGLERMTAVMNGVDTVFATDLFTPIFAALTAVTGKIYGANSEDDYSFRVIADHLRAATFILADPAKIVPANVDQGYILRRLIRRAIRHARRLGLTAPFTASIAESVIGAYCEAYPELADQALHIQSELAAEEQKFSHTLERGLREVEKRFSKFQSLTGEDAFVLYSTYGFPLELTEELAREQGQKVDREVFAAEFKKHQDLSRSGAAAKFAGGLADHSDATIRLHTATHLLHAALRQVLGPHVEQKGSNITKDRLRFDFSHGEKMTKEQLAETEAIVNRVIEADLPVHFEMMPLEAAKAKNAIGLFEDKYAALGNQVKVYFVGDEAHGFASAEVCGGPHVEKTGQIGVFRIRKEEASSAGVRRIKAIVE